MEDAIKFLFVLEKYEKIWEPLLKKIKTQYMFKFSAHNWTWFGDVEILEYSVYYYGGNAILMKCFEIAKFSKIICGKRLHKW